MNISQCLVEHDSNAKSLFTVLFQEASFIHARLRLSCTWKNLANAFCFTNLSCLVLEIFRFLEKHPQNLNTLQNSSASWNLQMGFNSVC